jgi:hypothetical protein
MRKATAIYHAPEGDNEVVHMCGVRFFDGESVDLNSDEHGHLVNKLPTNPHFEVELGEEQPDEKLKRGPGRPRKDEVKLIEVDQTKQDDPVA